MHIIVNPTLNIKTQFWGTSFKAGVELLFGFGIIFLTCRDKDSR